MSILSFKEVCILREQLLTEAYDYNQMFDKVLSLTTEHDIEWVNSQINRNIELSQKYLIKNFRIIWFLKFVQWFISYDIRSASNVELKKYYDKLTQKMIQEFNTTEEELKREFSQFNPNKILTQYKHYLDLNIKAITDFNPQGKLPSQLFEYFDKLEKEWSAELEGTIKYTDQPLVDESPDEDENIKDWCTKIIDFGDGWYWVDLESSSCDLESRALGHCGNAGNSGSTLLSLRYLNKRRKDPESWLWEPHVTFELEEDNMLGQMKGKNNDKPSPKYHDRIIALLTHKITTSSKGDTGFLIKGIRGGGYKPETNFSLDDLTPEQADRVIEENPNLDVTNLVIEKYGDRVKIKDDIITISKFPMYSKKELCLSDLYEQGSSRDNVSIDTVTQICSEGYYDASHWDIPYRNVGEILSDITLSNKNIEKIIAFLDETYPDWRDEDENWEEYVKDNDISEVEDVIQRAYLYAEESATQDEVMNDFEKSVDGSDYIRFDNWDEGFSLIFNKKRDSGLLQNLINHDNPNSEDSYDDKEVFWTWDEPRYGWSGSVNDTEFNEQLDGIIDDLG